MDGGERSMRWMIWKSDKIKIRHRATASRKVRRRPFAPRWLRPTAITIAAIWSLGLIFGVPVWLWHSGLIERTSDQLWKSSMRQSVRIGLSIQDIRLEGRNFSSKADIMKALGLDRGDPILQVDLPAARQRVIQLPWVREASIIRQLPDKIRISIKERKPMALWQRHGKFVLVDTFGVEVTKRNLNRFGKLIIIVGKDAPSHAPTLFAMLDSEPELAQYVTGAVWVGARRWNVRLKPGVRIQLPETDPHIAWHRLARLNMQHKLLSRDVKTIDLRLPDRLILEPGALGHKHRNDKGRRT